MKRFKKLLPIAVIVSMLMALLVPATPVAGEVLYVMVNMSNSTPSASGVFYGVNFKTNVNLTAAALDSVTVIFPAGTNLSGATTANVTIGISGSVLTPASGITVTGTTVTANVSADVPANDRVVIKIQNVTNPEAGAYQLQVYTSKETDPVLSEVYNLNGKVQIEPISLSDSTAGASNITYSFNFKLENFVPQNGKLVVGFPANTDLTDVTPGDCSLSDTTASINATNRDVSFIPNPTMSLKQNQPYQVSIKNVKNATTTGTNYLNINTSTYDGGSRDYLITGGAIHVKTPAYGGADGNNGLSWGTAKATIQAAVNAASVGSYIRVGYGTYTENVTVNKPRLTIDGSFPANGGAATTTKATAQSPGGITVFKIITANYVAIENFIISGATGAEQAGVKIDNANNCQIRQCSITGNYWGVHWSGANSNNGVWASSITNNTDGIHASSGQGNWAGHCNIAGNTDYGVYNAGDWVGACENWWGHASGPSGPRLDEWGNPNGLLPGKGDKVTQKVWCNPWLTRNTATVKDDAIAYYGISTYANKGWNIISTPIALDGYVREENTGNNYAASTWGGLWDLGMREDIYTGTTTGGSSGTTLVDTGQNWTADELIGLKIYRGAAVGTIVDNTNNTLVTTGITDWGSGQAYRIEDGHALKLYYTVVTDVGRQYALIYSWDSNNKVWVQATASTVLNPVDGFYVRMKEADCIPILFSPDKSVPVKYLYAGWNLVGYSYMPIGGAARGETLSASIEIALKTIERVSSAAGDVKGYAQVVSPPMNQYPWVYIPPAEGGAGGTFVAPELKQGEVPAETCKMVVGRGYWVFMANPGYLAGLTFTPMSINPQDW